MISTLMLSKTQLENMTAIQLGWGPSTVWNADQIALIQSQQGYVASGIRRVYKPSPYYAWSFLRPAATLTLVIGQNTVKLPDDFSGIQGEITISMPNGIYQPLKVYNSPLVDRQYAVFPGYTGLPQMASLRALRGVTETNSSTQELYFFPIADQNYTIQFQYEIIPDYLDGNHPWVYGGAEHAETFLVSCLAVAEERSDDNQGVQALAFQRELQSSMDKDKSKKPQWYGRNRDRSDDYGMESPFYSGFPPVEINGTVYN